MFYVLSQGFESNVPCNITGLWIICSMYHHRASNQMFYISNTSDYTSCSEQAWIIVEDVLNTRCYWSSRFTWPRILYSASDRLVNFNDRSQGDNAGTLLSLCRLRKWLVVLRLHKRDKRRCWKVLKRVLKMRSLKLFKFGCHSFEIVPMGKHKDLVVPVAPGKHFSRRPHNTSLVPFGFHVQYRSGALLASVSFGQQDKATGD